MKNTVFLLIGGNLGNRLLLIEQAEILIEQHIGTITKKSSIYESEPWGFNAKNFFLNAVVEVETEKTPQEVLFHAHEIEKWLGRNRTTNRYTSRTMDIDILFYNDLVLDTELLKIPHPKIQERKFTLLPLCEIAASKNHPTFGWKLEVLLSKCNDKAHVMLFKNADNVL